MNPLTSPRSAWPSTSAGDGATDSRATDNWATDNWATDSWATDSWATASDSSDRRRRPGYGPSTVPVGARGTLTRERIIAETLLLFERKGFPETSVRDIAEAAHISRPTLYRYFAGKEEIFAELMKECGSALLDLLDRVEPLGPTPEGFANLESWLVEWTEIYGAFRIVFGQWNQVDLAGTTTQKLVRQFSRVYNAGVADHLRRCGVTALEPRVAALAPTSVVNRFNYLLFVPMSHPAGSHRTATHPAFSRTAVLEIAVVLQRLLFPETPSGVFSTPVAIAVRPIRGSIESSKVTTPTPTPTSTPRPRVTAVPPRVGPKVATLNVTRSPRSAATTLDPTHHPARGQGVAARSTRTIARRRRRHHPYAHRGRSGRAHGHGDRAGPRYRRRITGTDGGP